MTTAVPAGVTTLMAKTPFLRNVSSSFDDDDEDNEEDENAELEPEQNDDNIQIIKKNNAVQPQANAMAVVNKMSQSVYADHQNQAQYPPKGKQRPFYLLISSKICTILFRTQKVQNTKPDRRWHLRSGLYGHQRGNS